MAFRFQLALSFLSVMVTSQSSTLVTVTFLLTVLPIKVASRPPEL